MAIVVVAMKQYWKDIMLFLCLLSFSNELQCSTYFIIWRAKPFRVLMALDRNILGCKADLVGKVLGLNELLLSSDNQPQPIFMSLVNQRRNLM